MIHPAIEAHRLRKTYGEVVAVDSFDLTVTAGTVVSLLGPNGAGKTTIVRMLATLAVPTSGTASVCGYDVVRRPDAVRSVISLTGQFAALDDNLTARENLMLMARLRGYGKPAAGILVDQLVDRFEMGDFRDQLVKTTSGGQRRRVDLAASLVVQPRLLVLDEPTTGLDPHASYHVRQAVRTLARGGRSLVLVTHHVEDIAPEIDRVVLLRDARIIADGPKRGLLTSERLGELFDIPATLEEREGEFRLW